MKKLSKEQKESLEYYGSKYISVFDSSLVLDRPLKLKDHTDTNNRCCRYCGKGKPNVTFRKVAHAIPEFLGNRSIQSLNECDSCNEFFANQYEDHLSKWMNPLRSASQMKGKSGIPSYKNKDESVTIRHTEKGPHITFRDGDSPKEFPNGPGSFQLPQMETQPFVPLNAAKALIKAGISVCPKSLLKECSIAIDWLLTGKGIKFDRLPILYSFTPGPAPYKMGKVFVLQRKTDDKIPYLWVIIASGNIRFQFFIPGCQSDSWMSNLSEVQLKLPHFPVPFGEGFRYGDTKFSWMNWASNEPQKVCAHVSFHYDRIESESIDPRKQT